MIPDLFLGGTLSAIVAAEHRAQADDIERRLQDRINYPTQRFIISDSVSFPSNPRIGDLWCSAATSRYHMYDGTNWVCISPIAASVDTSQTTTSLTYTDLATAGPTITMNTGTKAIAFISVHASNSAGGNFNLASVDISGASTIAAADSNSAANTAGATNTMAAIGYWDNLTAGSNTFKLRYRVSAGTGTFQRRKLVVVGIP